MRSPFCVLWLLIASNLLDAGACPSTSPSARLFFANGMRTATEEEALDSAAKVTDQLKTFRTTAFNYDCLESAAAFDSDPNTGLQLLQAYLQLRVTETSEFWRWLSGIKRTSNSFASTFETLANITDGTAYVLQPELQKHVASYTSSIGAGMKVIVVAHSQGNFYANQAYSVLFGRQATSSSFSIVGVATPADRVAGGGQYTTLDEDFIRYIPLALAPTTSFPRCSNTPEPIKGFECHDFKQSYLVGTDSMNRILDQIVAALPTAKLPNPNSQFLSFQEGNPGTPDGTTMPLTVNASASSVLHVTPSALALSQMTDGMTIVVFGPPDFEILHLNLTAPVKGPGSIGDCKTGLGFEFSRTVGRSVSFNSVQGFAFDVQKSWIEQGISRCGFSTNDVALNSIALYNATPVTYQLDAVGLTYSQGGFK